MDNLLLIGDLDFNQSGTAPKINGPSLEILFEKMPIESRRLLVFFLATD